MTHILGLFLVLAALWLLLSGHYNGLLLALGALSCAGVVALALRMDVVDREGQPIHLTRHALGYWLWLLKEIMLATWNVVLYIVLPWRRISPTMVEVTAHEKTELGQVIYANSITLTPGTLSAKTEDDKILVHALTREAALGLQGGEMDRRVQTMEGRPKDPEHQA